MTVTASSVSAALRKAGFNPASPSDIHREGLKAKQSGPAVYVYADLDNEREAVRLAMDARDALEGLGYSVTAVAPTGGFHVSKTA